MRELFQGRKQEEEEENQVQAFYKRFTKQGPAYFGDLDEADGKVLTFEKGAEEEGKLSWHYHRFASNLVNCRLGGGLYKPTGGSWSEFSDNPTKDSTSGYHDYIHPKRPSTLAVLVREAEG